MVAKKKKNMLRKYASVCLHPRVNAGHDAAEEDKVKRMEKGG